MASFEFLLGFVGGSTIMGCFCVIMTENLIRRYVRKGWCDFRKQEQEAA
jgi:hypothetical protein